jgi:hypothetical protein
VTRLGVSVILSATAAATSRDIKALARHAEQAADRLAEYAAAGVSHLVVGLVGEDWPGQCDLLAQARAALEDSTGDSPART